MDISSLSLWPLARFLKLNINNTPAPDDLNGYRPEDKGSIGYVVMLAFRFVGTSLGAGYNLSTSTLTVDYLKVYHHGSWLQESVALGNHLAHLPAIVELQPTS